MNTATQSSGVENSQYSSILESIPTAVVAGDSEGRIATFNRMAEQITGYKAHQTLGKPIETVFQLDAFKNPAVDFKNLFRTKKTAEIETQFALNGQKNRLHLSVVISPLTSAGKEIMGTVLSFTDITRIKKLEMQANRTRRLAAMGEMAVRIAHEIRNLISTNLANINTTRTRTGGPCRRKDPVFAAQTPERSFREVLRHRQREILKEVAMVEIAEDSSPPIRRFDPSHPDADENGYVALPNINLMEEMVNMISATRSYEANVTALQAAKNMALQALEIGQ